MCSGADPEHSHISIVSGPLIGIADRVMDTIYTKYFKGLIRYEGIQRIDEYPMPREVLREAVLNAVVHKDYSTGNPIHIKIYDGKVVIYNDCQIPPDVQPKELIGGIGSMPHNPLIAGAFFRSGQVEAWGRGIEKMKKGCLADRLPEPEFDIKPTMFAICFHIRKDNGTKQSVYSDSGIGDSIGETIALNNTQSRIMAIMRENPKISAKTIAAEIGIAHRNVETNM
jgi:ATP-dependent DNA helicase RecG